MTVAWNRDRDGGRPVEEVTLIRRPNADSVGLLILVIVDGTLMTYPLPARGELSIGRARSSGICIDHPQVSRRHAVLHLGSTMFLEDLGSGNGTRVQGRDLQALERR